MKFLFFIFVICFSQMSRASVVRPTHFPQTTFKYVYAPSFRYKYSLPIKITNKILDNVRQSLLSKATGDDAVKGVEKIFSEKNRKKFIDWSENLGTSVDGSFPAHGFGYEVEVALSYLG